ncbi:MAG: DNA alkylation repair protein [Candidatus Thorarchaeota archaeon]
MSATELVKGFQIRLDRISRVKTKEWWERSLKGAIEFRGVNVSEIQEELESWYERKNLDQMDPEFQLKVALSFFKGGYAEDKLAGMLLFEDYLIPRGELPYAKLLPEFEKLFDKKQISDCSICDWFCTRVLNTLIQKDGNACARGIANWHTAENLWRARASLVSFVHSVDRPEYRDLILISSSTLIKRDERFAKTGVGWILREMSKLDMTPVIDFIEAHLEWFSTESLDNAMKNMDFETMTRLKTLHENA